MATKKWALLDEDDSLVYIDSVERGTSVHCIGCNSKLIYNKGQKHSDAYWRHPASSQCKGGSAESLVHLLSKKLFVDGNITTLDIPESKVVVTHNLEVVDKKRTINLCDYTITDEEYIPNTSIKPDLTLINKKDDSRIYIEIRFTHQVPANKLSKYRNLSTTKNFSFTVLEFDVRSAVTYLEGNNLSRLIKILSGKVEDTLEVIMSNRLALVQSEITKSTYQYNSPYGVCPNLGKKELITPRDCYSCPYNVNVRGNKVTCRGILAYSCVSDIINKDKVTKSDRLDINPIPLAQLKVEEISKELLEALPSVSIEGICKKCGHSTVLVTGRQNNVPEFLQKDSFEDARKVKHCVDLELEKWCPKCDKYEKIYCPCCKKQGKKIPITVWNNSDKSSVSYGSVYARCSEQRDNGCGLAVTLFKDKSCKEYAEELMYIKGIDTFINRPVEFKKSVEKIRQFLKNVIKRK